MPRVESHADKTDTRAEEVQKEMVARFGYPEPRTDSQEILPALDLEEDGTVGNEAIIQRSKRHWRCREVAWLRFGFKDPWADGGKFPYKKFFEEFNVPEEAGLRLTAYRDFLNRGTELELIDYDLIVIRTKKGFDVFLYETHEAMLEANEKAQEVLRRIEQWYDDEQVPEEGDEASANSVEDPKIEQ